MNDHVRSALHHFRLGAVLLLGAAIDTSPTLRHTHDTVVDIKEILVALTQNEQRAVNDMAQAITAIASDLTTTQAAAADVKVQLQAVKDAMTAQGNADAATIAQLQAAMDAQENDVIGALEPMTAQLTQMDAGLKDPNTPLTPTA